ncbi:unnamed protein product [Eruca vesicaria subsp. sativa]|uniref:Uncharacterized protein n=1 Tax=Eruca vesicaria subsp. sativa TaxID=29727 RepID=A0ABC8M0G0_ERUVS|nr:unnamed protein product [Eruca vesicaria subsp. sativa]
MSLRYHESGREGTCLPQVGQWNMMNKVATYKNRVIKYSGDKEHTTNEISYTI